MRSLEEDLKRRDFTVNAFALDEEAQIVDLFDGMTDLENCTLRAVGIPAERFNEDALRIMRGFRFAATLTLRLNRRPLKLWCKPHRSWKKSRWNVALSSLINY